MVKNQEGTILRHPIALSQFDEQPDLLTCQSQGTNEKVQQELKQKTEQILKELNLSYRFYNIKDLREAFIKHNLLPYSLSKNGNLNIYSPMDKTVVDAQYLLKKNKMRLQTFTLSNDQFYDIIRDLTNQFRQGKHSFIESIVDKEKSALEDSETRKIVLKELNLEGCGAYSTIASKLDSKEQETVKKGIKSHLEYIANKVFDKARFTSESYKNVKGRSLWGKVNHQFLIELLKYPHWDNTKNVNRRRLSYNKRRKGRRFSF
jgi:hypothetical protein